MFGLFMTEKRRQLKLDELSAKIGDAKKALKETKPSSVEAIRFREYLKNEIMVCQLKIERLKGKN